MRLASTALLISVLWGCSTRRPSGSLDGGPPGDSDAGPDAGWDSGVSGGDAGWPDAGSDGGWVFTPTVQLTTLTQNNTSACGTATAPCTTAWTQTQQVTYGSGSSYSGQTKTVTAFWNGSVPPGPRVPGAAQGYVSKVPVGTLLPGYQVPIWIETQNWWGNASHIDNGEDSADSTQIADQVADHISRGFAGQVVDWYGPGTKADLALSQIRASAEASDGGYKFAVMIDKAYFQYTCPGTVACLESALAYLAAQDESSPAYLTDSSGHPLVFFFINQYYPADYAILTSPEVDAGNARFVMYEPNGFPGGSPGYTIGEYAWVNPSDESDVTTTGDAGTFATEPDVGFKDLDGFFGNASRNPTAYTISEAHRGFDDNLANWSLNRIIDQQCGATWRQTFDHSGSFGGSASYVSSLQYLQDGGHLDLLLVDTWDDYEEGSEIETGIDNCLTGLDVTLSGTRLSWTPIWGTDPMNAAVSGTEASLAEYDVYAALQGATTAMRIGTIPCASGACGHSLDLASLGISGGVFVFYVLAVGQPSIRNRLGGPTAPQAF